MRINCESAFIHDIYAAQHMVWYIHIINIHFQHFQPVNKSL